MDTMTTRFTVSPDVCSSSDKDGSTILHIQRDKIYNIIGVGSMIWAKLAASRNGLAPIAIVDDLGAQFNEVPRRQIEGDVQHLLESFQHKGIILAGSKPNHFAQPVCDSINRGFVSFARKVTDLFVKLRLRSLAAFCGLFAVDMILRFASFSAVYHTVKRWPVTARETNPETVKEICEAVVTAMMWYPKQAMCLQRSAATTCLLRSSGVPAQMIIGCQKLPFLAHAWVEVGGEVVNDDKQVKKIHKVLDRC